MKKAQDVIAPSAVLCLSVGLFAGSMLVSNIKEQSQPTMAQQLPTTADATLVDSNEGRLLERLPESPDLVTAKLAPTNLQDAPPETTQVPQAKHATSAELVDLFRRTHDQQSQWAARKKSPTIIVASDIVALIMCAFCLAFGLTVAYVDFLEICEDDDEKIKVPSPPSTTMPVVEAEGPCCLLRLNVSSILCIIAVVGIGMALCCSSQPEAVASAACTSPDELEELMQVAKYYFEPQFAVIADRFLMMVILACIAFGAAVSQADMHEMMDQMRDASDHSTYSSKACERSSREVKPSRHSCHSILKDFRIVATFLATCMLAMLMRFYMMQNDLVGAADSASAKELSDLVSPHIHFSVIPEKMIMMAVSVGIVFGAVVCQADLSDMADEFRNVSDCNTSPAKVSTLCTQEAVPSRHSWQKFLQCFTVAVTLLVTLSMVMFIWSQMQNDLGDVAESARTRELSYLLLPGAQSALIPDRFLTMAVAASVAFGTAVSRADVHEMIEEMQTGADRSTSPADACVPCTQEAEPPCHSWHRCQQYLTIAVSLLVALRVGILVWSSKHNDVIDAAELFPWSKELSALSPHLGGALIPDRCLMMWLVTCAAFGAAASQVDVHEMTDELRDASDHENYAAKELQADNHCAE